MPARFIACVGKIYQILLFVAQEAASILPYSSKIEIHCPECSGKCYQIDDSNVS